MDLAGLVDSLDQQIKNAKPIPLTNQVRLDKTPMHATLDEIRGTAPGAVNPLVDELDELLQHARPVPLTDQVRLPKPDLEDIVNRMRANLTADREAGN